jgi:hypothetical protein
MFRKKRNQTFSMMPTLTETTDFPRFATGSDMVFSTLWGKSEGVYMCVCVFGGGFESPNETQLTEKKISV